MCRFVARLAEWLPRAHFLALVRVDDLELAREIAARRDVTERSTILHVAPDEMADHLSAADAALFLRHTHTMNLVVTSAKLGEYLAAGLPVITTGANASGVNDFIRSRQAGVFLPDSLIIDDHARTELEHVLRSSADPTWRRGLSDATAAWLGGENDAFPGYVSFIRKVLS
jgi:glycosyltransferase involved in cell wall biosynthesis